MLSDWQAGLLSPPPGKDQQAAALLLSEICSGLVSPRRTHMVQHMQMQMGMDAHMSACEDMSTHTLTEDSFSHQSYAHPLSGKPYVPLISQLNNKSAQSVQK